MFKTVRCYEILEKFFFDNASVFASEKISRDRSDEQAITTYFQHTRISTLLLILDVRRCSNSKHIAKMSCRRTKAEYMLSER